MTVLTHWHKLVEAVAANRFAISKTNLDPRLVKKGWFEKLKEANAAPKFVIDAELYSVMTPESIKTSLEAMIECNVLRLPFNPMMIECTFSDILPDERFFLYLKDDDAQLFSLLKDQAIIHPMTVKYKSITDPKGIDFFTQFDHLEQGLMSDGDYDRFGRFVCSVMMRLISIAFVITNIQGVEREVIEVPRLNKQREKSKKPAIPTYTTLRIGHVYRQTGEAVKYVKGHLGKVHMRRGHTRRQRFGEGLAETKLIYIEPVLVNYRGGEAPQIKVKW